MDNIKRVGKKFRDTDKEGQYNIRREAENFPLIERATHDISPNSSHTLHFIGTPHPHRMFLNLYFKEVDIPCHPNPIDVFASAQGNCPAFPGSDGGVGYAIYSPAYFTQVGGFFTNYPAIGITVPLDGYYAIRFNNNPAGVAVSSSSGVLAGISVNGAPIIEAAYPAHALGLAFFSPEINLYTVAFMAAGDVVEGFMKAVDIAFWTPSDLCGLSGGQGTSIELVGAA